jgi:GNAT superfamily N-acetyltransferase
MLQSSKAMQDLTWESLMAGKFFSVVTKRGEEKGYLLEKSAIREIIRGDILKLFLDISMEGFALSGISEEFYRDVVNHVINNCDRISFVPYKEEKRGQLKIGWGVEGQESLVSYDRLGAYCTEKVVQCNSSGNHSAKILYFGGIMVYPELQNLEYGSALVKEAVKRIAPDFICYRTQNPQAYSLIRKVCDEYYPNGKPVPLHFRLAAETIAFSLLEMKDFDPETFIGKGTYGCCLYGKIPAPSRGTQPLFRELNPFRGDSMIIVGRQKEE